jgi:hypothetical protein
MKINKYQTDWLSSTPVFIVKSNGEVSFNMLGLID